MRQFSTLAGLAVPALVLVSCATSEPERLADIEALRIARWG